MKKLKKLLVLMVAFALISSIYVAPTVVQAAESCTISIDTDSNAVSIGDTVTVTIEISSSVSIWAYDLDLVYDSSVFQYTGSSTTPTVSSEHVLFNFGNIGAMNFKSTQWTVTFKAIAIGSSTFQLEKSVISDGGEDAITVNKTSSTVEVLAAGATDKTLGGLSVSGYTLSPSFAKWTQDYTCYVGSDVTSVTINATPGAAGNTPTISGNYNNLNYGSNKITITSYSNVDTSMVYTINVVRSEPATEAPTKATTEAPTEGPTEAPTTEAPTDPLPVVQATIGDSNKYVLMDLSSLEVPKGYKETTVTYSNEKVPAFTNETLDITLLYLTDKEDGTKGSYYIYDAESNSLFAYQSVKSTGVNYIMLEVTDSVSVPDGFTKTTTEILDKEAIGYVSTDNKEFVLFYAVNPEGSKGWYCYDIVEKTVQRYAGFSSSEQDDDNKVLLDNANDKIQSLNDKLDSVSTPFSSKTLFKCLMASLALLFVLICSTIYLLCRQVIKTSTVEEDELPDDGDEEFVSAEEARAFNEEAQRLQLAYTDELKSEIESMSTEEADNLDDTSFADEEITATTEEMFEDDYTDEIKETEVSDEFDSELSAIDEPEILDEKSDVAEEELDLEDDENKELHNEIADELVPELEEANSDETKSNEAKSDDVISFIDDIDESDDDLL